MQLLKLINTSTFPMLSQCISSNLKIDDKTGHVGIPINFQFLPNPVSTDFDTPHGDIHQRSDLLGRNVQPEIGT